MAACRYAFVKPVANLPGYGFTTSLPRPVRFLVPLQRVNENKREGGWEGTVCCPSFAFALHNSLRALYVPIGR